MHIQGNKSAVDRSSANPTVTTATAPTQRTFARITVGVQNFIDSLFHQNTVPAPARPLQASSPQWQTKPTLPSLASEQLRPALRLDNWQALQDARLDHPDLADDDKSLTWHAVQANAFQIAFQFQSRGVDLFGPDVESSVFYAVLREGKYYVAGVMLALEIQKNKRNSPDMARYLEVALDKKDEAVIKWLIHYSLKNSIQLPRDVLQGAMRNENRDQIKPFTVDVNVALGLKALPGTTPNPICAAWISTVSEKSGQTALHLAVALEDLGLVSTLLDSGADVNRINNANQTPLALALDKGLFDMATKLLERGAQTIKAPSFSIAEESPSNQGRANVATEPVFVENKNIAVSQTLALSEHRYQIPALLPSNLEKDSRSSAGKAVSINHGLDKVTALEKKEWVEFTKMAIENNGEILLFVQNSAHFQSFLKWMEVTMFPIVTLKIYNDNCSSNIEKLAEILESNTTVTTLVLGNQEFGSEGGLALAEMLKNNTAIATLELSDNRIYTNGFQALAEMLKFNSTITELTFAQKKIPSASIRVLLNGLETNTGIKTFKLSGYGNEDHGACALTKLLETNTTITTIDLDGYQIADIGVKALAETISTNNTVKVIRLKSITIGDNGAMMLAEGFNINKTVTTLELVYNGIGGKGVCALAEMLEKNKTITTIKLNGSSLGASGVWAFAKMLESNTSVRCVDLGDCDIGDDGVRVLADSLKINTTVTNVILQWSKISAEGASLLADMLKTNKAIKSIDLHQNKIGDDGAQALAEMLRTNTAITSIKLSDKGIGNRGWRALCESLENNASIRIFGIFDRDIDDLAMRYKVQEVVRGRKMLPLIETAALFANEMLNHQTPDAMQADLPILPLDVTRLIAQGIADNLPVAEAERILRVLAHDPYRV